MQMTVMCLLFIVHERGKAQWMGQKAAEAQTGQGLNTKARLFYPRSPGMQEGS